ncbi:MAG: DUF3800 domain-containing protein [Ignavibacteria bacterium]
MRYIYLDETQTEKYIGYGAFTTDFEIENEVIDIALENLKCDPDISKEVTSRYDNETIKRGYFHASDDSKNSHSHLCKQINEKLNGVFTAELFLKDYKDETSGNLYKLASSLCTLHALNTYEQIQLIFEHRGGLNKEKIKSAFDDLYKDMLKSNYQQPSLPSFFPMLEFDIRNKQEPGIQCVDFLLWTVQRELMGNNDWYNRIKSKVRTKSNTLSNDWVNYFLYINKDLSEIELNYKYEDIPKDSDNLVSNELWVKFFLYAIKVVNNFSKNGLPKQIIHFNEKLELVYKNRTNKDFIDYVENVIELYLYFFDMVPLVEKNTKKEDKEFLLLSKKYLGLTLRSDLISGVRTKIYLMKLRNYYLENNPAIFTN